MKTSCGGVRQKQMKFGAEALWTLLLNGIKIVGQVQISVSGFGRCGGECHAKSVLIFLSLSNPDLRGYLKGAQSGMLFPESSAQAATSKCPFFRNKVNRNSILILWEILIIFLGNWVQFNCIFYRDCKCEMPLSYLIVHVTRLCAPGLLRNNT